MVLLTYATMEAEKWEDKERPLPLKPVILPHITMALKKTLKTNREKIGKCGNFSFFMLGLKYNKSNIYGHGHTICSNLFLIN